MSPPNNPNSPTPFATTDPRQRIAPTVAGGRGNLGPGETAADRLLELTRNLENVLAQNREALARIKELETLGTSREQALAEAARERDALTAEATRTRAALQAQVLALQSQLKNLEDDDLAFLREAIKELNKLLAERK
jgi:chromosome segregation ATPase